MRNQHPPPVWKWYVVYCLFMAVLYLLCVAGAAVILLADPRSLGFGPAEAIVMGVIFGVTSAVLLIVYATAPLLPRRPWAWVYHLVLICIGMTGCALPASVALLIFWIKPEVKGYFGR